MRMSRFLRRQEARVLQSLQCVYAVHYLNGAECKITPDIHTKFDFVGPNDADNKFIAKVLDFF